MTPLRSRDSIEVRIGEGRDPDLLSRILVAHFEYETMRRRRRRLTAIAAAGAVLFGWSIVWRSAPSSVRSIGLALCIVALPVAIVAAIREYRWHCVRERLLRNTQKDAHE